MTLPRTLADVLAEHVVFEVECIDRMHLNVYVPKLQYAAGLIGYLQRQSGMQITSTATLAKATDRFAAAVHRFATDHQVPWVNLAKGQRKDDVLHEWLALFQAAGRVRRQRGKLSRTLLGQRWMSAQLREQMVLPIRADRRRDMVAVSGRQQD